MARAFTTDYEHFANPQTGLLPYLASSVKELIQNENTEALQQLIDDIVFTADSLYDLLDEVGAAKKKYDQLKNKMDAIQTALAEKEAAIKAIQEEMKNEFGVGEEPQEHGLEDLLDGISLPTAEQIQQQTIIATPELPSIAPFAPPVSPVPAVDAEMEALLSDFTIESVIGSAASPATDELKEAGLIFNDEIDAVALAREEAPFDDEYDDEGLYMDFDIDEEDVDDGYQPLDGDNDILSDMGIGDFPPMPDFEPSSLPPLGTSGGDEDDDEDDYGFGSNIAEDDELMDFISTDFEEDEEDDDDIFSSFDDYGDDEDEDADLMIDPTTFGQDNTANADIDTDDDDMVSGIIDDDFFK